MVLPSEYCGANPLDLVIQISKKPRICVAKNLNDQSSEVNDQGSSFLKIAFSVDRGLLWLV